jgi:hypothetical protein
MRMLVQDPWDPEAPRAKLALRISTDQRVLLELAFLNKVCGFVVPRRHLNLDYAACIG